MKLIRKTVFKDFDKMVNVTIPEEVFDAISLEKFMEMINETENMTVPNGNETGNGTS